MEPVTSWDFIKDNYRPDDRVAIVIRNRGQNYTLQRLLTAADASSPRFQRYLRYENASGADIYISMNVLKPDASGRTKSDIGAIRHLYLDLDQDGDARLKQMLASDLVPKPNYVLDTSPGKHQVIWRVAGFTVEQAEQLLRSMAREFGGDPAATDTSRVLRLPGFHNKKFAQPVRVEGYRVARGLYGREHWRALHEPIAPLALSKVAGRHAAGGAAPSGTSRTLSQSEHDWAWVREQLRAGVPHGAVKQALVARRPDKPKPEYYADRTVRKAREY